MSPKYGIKLASLEGITIRPARVVRHCRRLVTFICVVLCGWSGAATLQAPSKPAAQAPSQRAPSCPIELAPKKFPVKTGRRNSRGHPFNHGIVPSGFVALADKTPVVHGVDVSKWQSHADFKRIKECGGRFAYIRLSAGALPDNELEYRVHWANARGSGLLPGPYHYLTVPLLDLPPDASASEWSRLAALTLASASSQATLFAARLREVLSLEGKDPARTGSRPFLPVVLTIAAVSPHVRKPGDAAQYGPIYAAAACKWIETVKQEIPSLNDKGTLLFTYPYIFKDYGFDAAPCALKDLPVWIANFPETGERFSSNAAQKAVEEALCLRTDGRNRCVFQLYSSFGGFAQFDSDEALDLDRFFGTEQEFTTWLQTISR
ncbi:hypothetical protein H5407_13155 [Mitsuaria sp. WAJ17]|uniref:GH25 family lysozyme n=1 Tax=Mitsuaria sp. WAJ17 TaxID=2761452 RepID=UPI001600CBE3|nr:GH25 family lysozyme [Mitsuaria sp. WAJ17]MBB2486165.1 hypothetical protein [Mitsuaria sp. WAJ17]